jgi:tRNA A37 methylthiotransferase MiaB
LFEKEKAMAGSILNSKGSVCFVISGCPESRMDVAVLERQLVESLGFVSIPDYRRADQIIFFGCSDNQDLEDNSRRLVELLRERKRPDAGLIVTGCLSRIVPELSSNETRYPELIPAVEGILEFGPEAWRWSTHYQYRPSDPIQVGLHRDAQLRGDHGGDGQLLSFVRKSRLGRTAVEFLLYPWKKYTSSVEKKAFRFWRDPEAFCIKISTGCCKSCTYCSIRQSRGRVKSKPIETIVQEFEEGLDRHYRKFVLLGTNIGDYGLDRGSGLVDLLDHLLRRQASFELALRNVNPEYVIAHAPRLAEMARTGHISLLHTAIQTGSDRLLKLMRRNTPVENFVRAVRLILRASPKVSVMTQVMVGFPGENERDFAATLDLLRRLPFDYVETFSYTDRPNTVSARLGDRPDPKVVDRRARKIRRRNFTQRPITKLRRWSLSAKNSGR